MPREDPYTLVVSPLRLRRTPQPVEQGQIDKIKQDTGLDVNHQRALTICKLDKDLATLLYYCYRVSFYELDPGTVDLVYDYIPNIVLRKLVVPPSLVQFWTQARLAYLPRLQELKRMIAERRNRTRNAQTITRIDEFLDYLATQWGVQ
jgi:hypothetical protein